MLCRDRICGLKTEPKCSVSRPRPRPNARDLETKVLFSKPVWSRDLTSSVASHCVGLVLTDAVGLDTLRHHVVDASLGRRGGTDAASSGRRRTLLSTAVRTTPTRPIRAVRRRCGGVHQAGIIIRSIACSAWRADADADARARRSRTSHSLFALPRLPAQSITHTHTRLTALCPGLPGWASTRKVEPTWILLEQETLSGSEIHWAICKSAPCSRQITTPAPHRSVFTGRMPFLPPNQQCQSTEGNQSINQ